MAAAVHGCTQHPESVLHSRQATEDQEYIGKVSTCSTHVEIQWKLGHTSRVCFVLVAEYVKSLMPKWCSVRPPWGLLEITGFRSAPRTPRKLVLGDASQTRTSHLPHLHDACTRFLDECMDIVHVHLRLHGQCKRLMPRCAR